MFQFMQEPSSGIQSQCLAKITGMVLLCWSVWACHCHDSIFWLVHVCSSSGR